MTFSKKIIIMADLRSRVTLKDHQTLNRHSEYIGEFSKYKNYENSQLVVIQPTVNLSRSSKHSFKNLIIYRISILDLLFIQKRINKVNVEIILMVAGDPWGSYFFTLLLKSLLFNFRIPIQLQVHAELSSSWAKLNLRNRIRQIIAFRTLKRAQSIRVVLQEQKKYLSERLSIEPSRFVVVPVKLNIGNLTLDSKFEKHPNSIGLVGRIHEERNIAKFAQIAKYFLERTPDLRIVIVGNSIGSKKLETLLRGISSTQVDFLGSLDGSEMELAWSKIGVLISTAESESYGRSIREALMHEVPVLAFSSMGSRDLQYECPDSVRLFTNVETLPELFKMYESIKISTISRQFMRTQLQKESKISQEIAASWKETADRRTIR